MISSFVKKAATRTLRKKAVELYEKGNTVEEIVEKFVTNQDVLKGLAVLGITDQELEEIIRKEVKEEK